ncbi:MAG TPA: hypothetical protein VI564_09365, partial [Candidatus Nanoarchaeia archaeon]|nr:hypothetical protein [Candidatus Nanoarchaeia archaeon]
MTYSIIKIIGRPFYFLIAALASFVIAAISILLMNLSLLFDNLSPGYTLIERINLVINLLFGLFTNNTTAAILIIIITALLAGINISLAVFKLNNSEAAGYKGHSAGATGTIASVMASGCSSCGLSIIAAFG